MIKITQLTNAQVIEYCATLLIIQTDVPLFPFVTVCVVSTLSLQVKLVRNKLLPLLLMIKFRPVIVKTFLTQLFKTSENFLLWMTQFEHLLMNTY